MADFNNIALDERDYHSLMEILKHYRESVIKDHHQGGIHPKENAVWVAACNLTAKLNNAAYPGTEITAETYLAHADE